MINHFELLENIVRKNLLCLILLVNSQQKYLELILFDFFFLGLALFTYTWFCMGLLDIILAALTSI